MFLMFLINNHCKYICCYTVHNAYIAHIDYKLLKITMQILEVKVF